MSKTILNLQGRNESLFVLLFFICLSFIYLGANIFNLSSNVFLAFSFNKNDSNKEQLVIMY